MEQDIATAKESKTYQIGGVTYRMEPASFEQHEWLAHGPLQGLDFGAGLTGLDIDILLTQRGPELLGMILLADGQTREQKCEAGLEAARDLGRKLKRQLDPSEVRAIGRDFFLIDGRQNLLFFADLRALEARIAAEPTGTPSPPASVSLPEATSPGATGSPGATAPETASAICAASSSGSSPT